MNIFVKIFQVEFVLLFFDKVVEPKSGKVRDQDVFRQVAFFNAWKVVESLCVSAV
ncbi:MAG TPA: hypothetical protein PLK28_05790 [Candidatus Rifleibacterium sp.]|nr:hypothetical protein [Candidatus Rifleibacterium sp.]HOI90006.1 hypothetical protein [Candidatus Rifleibacterium sp.]